MEISQEQAQTGFTQVTILKLAGELDASNYRQVIAAVQAATAAGAKDPLLDLSDVNFLSSSGLVALHSIALLMRGEQLPDMEQGWGAINAVADFTEHSTSPERHFKLLNPQPRVLKTLAKAGFDRTLEVFDNREAALAAFR